MRWATLGYGLVGAGQLTFALDDAMNGNVDFGFLLNLASGLGMLAAAWSLSRTTEHTWRPLVATLSFVALVRLADLATSIGDGIDAQLLAFLLIVGGAVTSAWGALRTAPRILRGGAALGALGAIGYVLVWLSGAHETGLWALAALVNLSGWGLAAWRLPRDIEAAT